MEAQMNGNGPPPEFFKSGNGPPAEVLNGNGPPAEFLNGNGPPAEFLNGNGPPSAKLEIPFAKQQQLDDVVTDYVRESLDKVAAAEGFQNYDVIFDHGSSIGDGFVGIILRVTINEKGDSDKFLNVLAKIPPGKTRREAMKVMPLFDREVMIYNVLLPQFVEMQREKKISEADGFYNFPKVYFAEYDKEKDDGIIVMEDLRDSGYRMWSKFKPVNFEHAKLLMISLGRLHALSFAMRAKAPEKFEPFKDLNDYFSENFADETFKGFMQGSMMRALETLDPNDHKKREKVLKLAETLVESVKMASTRELFEPYGVVTHGDCWVNNYLYHYTKRGAPDHIVLIDWQIARYCSPVVDLVYFLFICTDEQMRKKHYDELLNIYHRSLKDLLDHLGGDTQTQFPLTTFLRHLKRFGKFGVIMSTFIMPMLQTKSEDLPDMDFMAEQMKNEDPAVMEEMMKQFTQSSGADAFTERMRGVLNDAIRYGYM
jgi:thiamine kinase-like enzyme